MSRLIRKTVILAKIETTSGVDAVPTGAANAIQAMDMSITPLDAKQIDTNIIYPWLGNSVSLVGSASVKCSFSVLLAGAGTAATAPAWGALMLACGHAETTGLTAPARVEYLPATDALKTATLYWYDDGLLHKLVGCFGSVKLSAKSGEAPKLTFDFVGLDAGVLATANATAVLTGWKVPVGVTKANVTDITLGCSYAAGALTGGTVYNSTGLTLDWGNQVNFVPMLTTEQVVLSDRKVSGQISLELTSAQEATQLAAVKANTLTGLGFVLGNTTGNKIMLYLPNVQLTSPKKEDNNGIRLIGFDLRAIPVAGNDEVRIVSL
ncbi:phage tail tube protein [Rhodoferax sp.]|uniref:phage tail tube protein n=1 Tax=Rhodoferax sp. TaxID=50421 RepID=UPI0026179106|nr:phage tail tube protein [Rhodoferax sp.]MDD2809296.1 phage tail tube protein [Rhodoferax sp.]MDD4942741.1 phage tail tube protein [Rhodoferax sp.]